MAGWYPTRTTTSMLRRSAKATIGVAVLAVALMAAFPVAFIVALFLMVFGHVVGGLIVIGASVLAVGAAIGAAALCGVRQLRHVRELLAGARFTGGNGFGASFGGFGEGSLGDGSFADGRDRGWCGWTRTTTTGTDRPSRTGSRATGRRGTAGRLPAA